MGRNLTDRFEPVADTVSGRKGHPGSDPTVESRRDTAPGRRAGPPLRRVGPADRVERSSGDRPDRRRAAVAATKASREPAS